jgi:hypothetical protein
MAWTASSPPGCGRSKADPPQSHREAQRKIRTNETFKNKINRDGQDEGSEINLKTILVFYPEYPVHPC